MEPAGAGLPIELLNFSSANSLLKKLSIHQECYKPVKPIQLIACAWVYELYELTRHMKYSKAIKILHQMRNIEGTDILSPVTWTEIL